VSVAVLMGSDSDYPTMAPAVEMLERFEVPHDVRVLSAHRMPDEMLAFGHAAADEGFRVLIAGAGGAAHLPGMLASVTDLPVIGVPVAITALDGMDSLLSIVQMPRGIPVATVAIGGAANAALLAVRILATADEELRARLSRYRAELGDEARAKNDRLPRPGADG
jgi:5-(carboxyamino)imidazole ribonucleotide mutase